MTTLVVAGLSDRPIDEPTCEAVTAAAALKESVVLGIVAEDPDAALADGSIAGVDQVVGVRVPAGVVDQEVHQHAVRTLIDDVRPQAVLMGFSMRTAAFAGALAQELDLGFASDVIRLGRDEVGELVATRLIYGGKVQAELGFDRERPVLVLLRPTAWSPADRADSGTCRIVESDSPGSRIRHVGFAAMPESDFDLTQQDIILSVGRGVGSREGIQVFSEVAKKLGAALAASRPIVDAGWLPHNRQVGQSGASVAPRVYLAFGISGALQHIVGIRGAQTVIAINTDADAPIFDVANYGAVADIFEVADELQKIT